MNDSNEKMKQFFQQMNAEQPQSATPHLTEDEMFGYFLEQLSPEVLERLDRHLENCPSCVEALANLFDRAAEARLEPDREACLRARLAERMGQATSMQEELARLVRALNAAWQSAAAALEHRFRMYQDLANPAPVAQRGPSTSTATDRPSGEMVLWSWPAGGETHKDTEPFTVNGIARPATGELLLVARARAEIAASGYFFRVTRGGQSLSAPFKNMNDHAAAEIIIPNPGWPDWTKLRFTIESV